MNKEEIQKENGSSLVAWGFSAFMCMLIANHYFPTLNINSDGVFVIILSIMTCLCVPIYMLMHFIYNQVIYNNDNTKSFINFLNEVAPKAYKEMSHPIKGSLTHLLYIVYVLFLFDTDHHVLTLFYGAFGFYCRYVMNRYFRLGQHLEAERNN